MPGAIDLYQTVLLTLSVPSHCAKRVGQCLFSA